MPRTRPARWQTGARRGEMEPRLRFQAKPKNRRTRMLPPSSFRSARRCPALHTCHAAEPQSREAPSSPRHRRRGGRRGRPRGAAPRRERAHQGAVLVGRGIAHGSEDWGGGAREGRGRRLEKVAVVFVCSQSAFLFNAPAAPCHKGAHKPHPRTAHSRPLHTRKYGGRGRAAGRARPRAVRC